MVVRSMLVDTRPVWRGWLGRNVGVEAREVHGCVWRRLLFCDTRHGVCNCTKRLVGVIKSCPPGLPRNHMGQRVSLGPGYIVTRRTCVPAQRECATFTGTGACNPQSVWYQELPRPVGCAGVSRIGLGE